MLVLLENEIGNVGRGYAVEELAPATLGEPAFILDRYLVLRGSRCCACSRRDVQMLVNQVDQAKFSGAHA